MTQPKTPEGLHPPSDNDAIRAAAAAIKSVHSTDSSCATLVADKSAADVLTASVRSGARSAVYAADLGQVARQLQDFRALLPNVTPYYAVKCNPDPVVLSFLARMGAHFDCASSHEISLVSSALGGAPIADRVIFANPFKAASDLCHARGLNIRLMSFDSIDELRKIALHFPSARLLLRIAVEDSEAKCPLSSKFGAHLDELDTIFEAVRTLRLDLVGVAFHVGSGCTSVESYGEALRNASLVMARAKEFGLPELEILDIGGGFPGFDGEAPITFRNIADKLQSQIPLLFKENVRVIAEPGRYIVTSAYSLAVEVALVATDHASCRNYYLADGVFGSFRDAWLFDVVYSCEVLLRASQEDDDAPQPSNLYGPTREAVDVISRNVKLPRLEPGDWLHFPNMGAYTMSLNTRRSGVERYKTIYHFRKAGGDA